MGSSSLQRTPKGKDQRYESQATFVPLWTTRSLYTDAKVEDELEYEEAQSCRAILRVMIVTQRPLQLKQLPILCHLSDEVYRETLAIDELVEDCGCFLSVNRGIIYFVHQSSTDFFTNGPGTRIFMSG